MLYNGMRLVLHRFLEALEKQDMVLNLKNKYTSPEIIGAVVLIIITGRSTWITATSKLINSCCTLVRN